MLYNGNEFGRLRIRSGGPRDMTKSVEFAITGRPCGDRSSRRRLSQRGAISVTHKKIQDVFASVIDRHDYELIFVDDGSKDGSLQEILSLREKDPR